ncbi:hypothetical protein [Fodinibius sp. SL11]|uniref:hypothetical protein n=1 Tax=Fodinibius sp. SL11 TaxID=3425690 RepID=UPI003F8850E6
MTATLDEIKHKEYMLAEKAQDIFEHQQDLQTLKGQFENLKATRPTTDKNQLTYQESIAFSKKVERYEAELNNVKLQIQKLNRELTALKHQAQKRLPMSGIKMKVSTNSDGGLPIESFYVERVEEKTGQSEGKFKIGRL